MYHFIWHSFFYTHNFDVCKPLFSTCSFYFHQYRRAGRGQRAHGSGSEVVPVSFPCRQERLSGQETLQPNPRRSLLLPLGSFQWDRGTFATCGEITCHCGQGHQHSLVHDLDLLNLWSNNKWHYGNISIDFMMYKFLIHSRSLYFWDVHLFANTLLELLAFYVCFQPFSVLTTNLNPPFFVLVPPQETISDGPVPWSSSNSVSFVAEQVSHHPPSECSSIYIAMLITFYTIF